VAAVPPRLLGILLRGSGCRVPSSGRARFGVRPIAGPVDRISRSWSRGSAGNRGVATPRARAVPRPDRSSVRRAVPPALTTPASTRCPTTPRIVPIRWGPAALVRCPRCPRRTAVPSARATPVPAQGSGPAWATRRATAALSRVVGTARPAPASGPVRSTPPRSTRPVLTRPVSTPPLLIRPLLIRPLLIRPVPIRPAHIRLRSIPPTCRATGPGRDPAVAVHRLRPAARAAHRWARVARQRPDLAAWVPLAWVPPAWAAPPAQSPAWVPLGCRPALPRPSRRRSYRGGRASASPRFRDGPVRWPTAHPA
jgi:hypothetical protein